MKSNAGVGARVAKSRWSYVFGFFLFSYSTRRIPSRGRYRYLGCHPIIYHLFLLVSLSPSSVRDQRDTRCVKLKFETDLFETKAAIIQDVRFLSNPGVGGHHCLFCPCYYFDSFEDILEGVCDEEFWLGWLVYDFCSCEYCIMTLAYLHVWFWGRIWF